MDDIDYNENEEPKSLHSVTVTVGLPGPEQVATTAAHLFLNHYNNGRLRELCGRMVKELARETVNEIAREALKTTLNATRQPTDSFGNPVGNPIRLTDVIVEQIKAWETEMVDPETGNRNDHTYRNKITRRDFYVKQALTATLQTEVRAAVAEIKEEARAFARGAISTAVADAALKLVK